MYNVVSTQANSSQAFPPIVNSYLITESVAIRFVKPSGNFEIQVFCNANVGVEASSSQLRSSSE